MKLVEEERGIITTHRTPQGRGFIIARWKHNGTRPTFPSPSYLSIPQIPSPLLSLLSDPPAHLETLHKYNYCSIRGRVVLGYLSLWVNEFPPSAPIYWLILLGLGRCASK